jgi:hypothetical protein
MIRTFLVAGLALALIGCNAAESPAPTATPTRLPGPTPTVTSYTLATTVWVEGFVVTVHDAIASLDAKGGPVTVLLRVENPGTDAATLDVPIRLTASGAAFEPVHGTELPEIPGGSAAELRIEFEVVGRATIDDGVLRIGRTADHAIQVPFGPGPVQTVTLEPQVGTLNAASTAGGIRLTLRGREVRWDLPDWHQQLPLATEALTVTYDVTYVGSFPGGLAFTADNIGLRLPNGTVVEPRHDGKSQSIVLIGARKTAKGLFSRFEIPNGMSGRFVFIVKDGSIQRSIPFTIPPP